MTEQKSVLQLKVHEERIKRKAWKIVSQFSGVTSIAMDDKTGEMTVVGEVDVPVIVTKLRKICDTEIVSVEVVIPPENKPEPTEIVAYPVLMNPLQYYSSYANSYYQPNYYSRVVMEEPKNTCMIL